MTTFERATLRVGLVAIALSGVVTSASAQTTVTVGEKEIQVHGSIQQGYSVTDENNFLTMETSGGSLEMTDAALNATSSLTPKLRVGAQVYVRNIGDLGNGRLQVDWAFADYRFAKPFGVRAGKIKTVLGLFTDTQDSEFLYTWALLPQGIYPLDLRSVTIAHVGADVYGTVGLGKAGSLSYTGYAGIIQDDRQGGYRYGLEDSGLNVTSDVETSNGGFDTRWTAPVNGLMAGYSFMEAKTTGDLFFQSIGMTMASTTSPWRRHALYADYQGGRVRVSGEWRREMRTTSFTPSLVPPVTARSNGAFAAVSYRLFEKLEVGSYYSHFIFDTAQPASLPNNHIYDTALASRFDLNQFWHLKVEGHFIDGVGNAAVARGFYLRNNTGGFDTKTRMLVVRTGLNF